ncbi:MULTISPECIES: type I restriction enzyme HsdR N-terminal domain-containing protein [unclassified Paraflavitalea]|uniref:type I restriction enzyme HsdR N-terminal domain-containing protein n=1 Tax=unclassified Paraflavitalea TaxID=2798305 RepID=UPI003D350297
MIAINYPKHDFRTKTELGKTLIFDEWRKLWVTLSPEEWVRQHVLLYLTNTLNYPSALIAIEKELDLGGMKKRFDVLVYDRNHQPWLMIECKAMDVNLDVKVLEQVMRYGISIPAPYLVITNGSYTLGWERRDGTLVPIEQFPLWT